MGHRTANPFPPAPLAMPSDTTLTFLILGATIALFISDRLRLDLVALLSLLAFALSGILTPAEAVAGFSDPVVLIIAGLFVVSGGLFETDVAARAGRALGRVAGRHPLRLTAVVMLSAGVLSGFMSSTGTVAVMLPIVAALAWNAGLSPSKLLIPLSFGSLLGGLLTLIGTAPNIVVTNVLAAAGFEPFGFFTFTPIGAVLLAAGVVFMLLVGVHLLPARASADGPSAPGGVAAVAADELVSGYALGPITRLRLGNSSPLVGRTLAQADLRRSAGISVLHVQRAADRARFAGSRARTGLATGDVLHVQGDDDAVRRAAEAWGLEPDVTAAAPLEFAEVLIGRRSRLIGRSVAGARIRSRYGVEVVALLRRGERAPGTLTELPLRFGDTLLVTGAPRRIDMLREEKHDFVVLARAASAGEDTPLAAAGWRAIAVMLAMMALLTFELVAAVIAVLLAAVAMVLGRCLDMDQAYRAINWESVVLIAAILPAATALDKTGGMALIVAQLGRVGEYGPVAMIAALFLLTSVFSQVISNTATTVLIAPIALGAALQMGVSPYPFLMTVAVAASCAFATPIASPVNTLVYGPGAYRFGDFFRLGALLQAVVFVITLLVVPALFPF
jgi:di/tricarboxylate transporter